MKICYAKNDTELKIKNIEAQKLFKKGLKKIANSLNRELNDYYSKVESLTEEVRRLTTEKEVSNLYIHILFKKLTDEYKEDEDELREFVFKKYDEIKAERNKENE